ncbi:MAG: hypothetical protein ABFR75_11370 [Acidobacteriota bacterium]
MKKIIFILVALILFSSIYILSGQVKNRVYKYFRVDRVISVTGEISKIKTEKSYHKRSFIVFDLIEKKEKKIYKIEVSPQWFYDLDLVEGNLIEVKGSLIKSGKDITLMAQSLTFEGKIVNFRDRNGFPLWRGNRRNKGMMKKMEKRRKRRH